MGVGRCEYNVINKRICLKVLTCTLSECMMLAILLKSVCFKCSAGY